MAPAEIQQTVNWDSPKLEFYQTRRCGKGVRAREAIAKGESIGIFGGHIVPLTLRATLPAGLEHFYFQVSDELILTHISFEQVQHSKIEFINHSCEPNVGFSGQIELVAMKDIQAQEAVTFDYAICTSETGFRMECFCGAPVCRKYISGDDWKISELQEKYRGFFQPYLEKKLRA
ncbi:MAG: SET domain-containing protein-lysine N-methyltransferase [Pyrinomonadaceae bacterium]